MKNFQCLLLVLSLLMCIISGCDLNDSPTPAGKPEKPEWLIKSVESFRDLMRDKNEYTYNSFYKPSLAKYSYGDPSPSSPLFTESYDTLIYNNLQQLVRSGRLDSVTREITNSRWREYDQQGRLARMWESSLGEAYDVQYTYHGNIIRSRTYAPGYKNASTDTIWQTYIYNNAGNLTEAIKKVNSGGPDTIVYVRYDQHKNVNLGFNLGIYRGGQVAFSTLSSLADFVPALSNNNEMLRHYTSAPAYLHVATSYTYNSYGLVELASLRAGNVIDGDTSVSDYINTKYEYMKPVR